MRRATKLLTLTVMLFAFAAPQAGAATSTSTLKAGVQKLVDTGAHRSQHAHVIVSVTHRIGGWAFGTAAIPPPKKAEGAGIATSFLAHAHAGKWAIGLQDTAPFDVLLRSAPASLVPAGIAKTDRASTHPGSSAGGAGGGPAFALPWGAGQTWRLVQGPHNTNGAAYGRPFTSLDLAGGDSLVRAAADGVVYRPCANLVLIDHGGGWETGYYHLPTNSIRVHTGEVVHRGDVLGTTGTAHGCGGYANGAHVHFSIYHFRTTVGTHGPAVWHLPTDDVDGSQIGDYVIRDGARGGQGCLQGVFDGVSHCAPGAPVFNDGAGSTPGTYHTLAAVNVYSRPDTGSPVVGSLPAGATVNIFCQGKGILVGNSSIWDQTPSGSWIPDYYVSTPIDGRFSPGIGQCLQSGTGTTGGGGSSGGGGQPTGPPPLAGGAHDTSFEHEVGNPNWASLNGGTQQNDVCDSTAHDGSCYLDVSGSAAPGNTFYQDFAYSPPVGQCITLSAWFRSRSASSFSGTWAVWFRNGQSDQSASTPFTVGQQWTHVVVSGRVPSPPSGPAWSRLRGQLYINSPGQVLDWDLVQWSGPYSC